METVDIITLKAFLNALSQLNKPLPDEIQRRLNEFGKSLTVNSTNVGELNTIAKNDQQLNKVYLTALKTVGETTRGIDNLPPEEKSNQNTPEIINTARDVFNAPDSVAAAKESKQPENIFKKIGQKIGDFFTGDK